MPPWFLFHCSYGERNVRLYAMAQKSAQLATVRQKNVSALSLVTAPHVNRIFILLL